MKVAPERRRIIGAVNTRERARAARERGGFARLDRTLLEVSGPKRVHFLHNLLSNDVQSLKTGDARLAALMDVKGHQIAWMRACALDDRLVCEVPSDRRDVVEAAFVHYKVGTPVRFAKSDAAVFAVVGVSGETIDGLPDGVRSWAADDLPAQGRVLHAPADSVAGVEAALRARFGEPLSKDVLDTLRVEDGIPWYGRDLDESHLLHETGQLAAYHSATKGCYVGQEVVARLEGRGGNVNKRLRGLRLDSPGARERDVVRADGKDVGLVTTVGDSPRFGSIALAYVHRSAADTGTRVTVGDANAGAAVADLPFRE